MHDSTIRQMQSVLDSNVRHAILHDHSMALMLHRPELPAAASILEPRYSRLNLQHLRTSDRIPRVNNLLRWALPQQNWR
jgi:hypothetical protein